MADEQFHEFQLDGKQMVFLFMAATVVAVVIFLCGVMVGRGVRDHREQQAAVQDALVSDPTVLAGSATVREMEAAAPAESPGDVPADPTAPLEPAPPQDERVAPPPAEGAAPPATGRAAEPSAERASGVPAGTPATTPSKARREPSARVYVVQVMSVTKRAEAETAARNLIGKGYDAFISETREGGARYRVRVGRFTTRRDAVLVAARLEREEKFREPWVTQQ